MPSSGTARWSTGPARTSTATWRELGLANTQAAAGQYDQAIAIYKELAAQKDAELPVDAVLMHLARTYLRAGKAAEAQQDLPARSATSSHNRRTRALRARRNSRR